MRIRLIVAGWTLLFLALACNLPAERQMPQTPTAVVSPTFSSLPPTLSFACADFDFSARCAGYLYRYCHA